MANSQSAAASRQTISHFETIRVQARPRLGGDFFRLMPVVVDSVLVLFSFESARLINHLRFGQMIEFPVPSAVIYALLLVTAMYLNEMYSFWQGRRTADLMTVILRSQGLALIMVAPVLYFLPGLIERGFLAIALLLQFMLLLGWRTFLERKLIGQFGRQRILIVGSGERARRLREALRNRGKLIFELVGCTVDRRGEDSSKSCRHLGSTPDLRALARREKIDHVVVAQDNPRDVFPAEALLQLKQTGVAITEGEFLYERLMGKILTDYVRPSVLIFAASPMHHTIQIWLKRLLDIVVAIVLLILTLPVMLCAAVLIKLTSKGPILYNHDRVGLGGRSFTIWKFRSMRTDAEKDGIRWAAANDDRVTPFGRIMRKARIDELPQLINVLKGDMSMVGPRPERPHFVRKLKHEIPFYDLRHTMRPGLSGWAQVRYQYGASVEDAHEKLRYDLYYVKNYSLFLDLTILLETTKVVLFGSGAR
jgi:sugar transferase (PEP-CTERM system associated)